MNPARRLLPLALFLPMLLIASTLIAVPQSAAAGSVRVTSTFGNAVVSRDGATTITVSGSGFQSVRGGFGASMSCSAGSRVGTGSRAEGVRPAGPTCMFPTPNPRTTRAINASSPSRAHPPQRAPTVG